MLVLKINYKSTHCMKSMMRGVNARTALTQNKLLAQGVKMAARKWTPAQRAAQSAASQEWKPWQHSTGAITETGKAIISRNAYRGGTRPLIRFTCWFYRCD